MLLAAAVISLLIWGYLVFAHGGFWRIRHAASPSSFPEESLRQNAVRIAVIVPARNEADVIGSSINSLLRQTGLNSYHIFLIDDGSTDSTAGVARDAATAAGRANELTVIQGSPLPAGWSGKLWAMQQGVA